MGLTVTTSSEIPSTVLDRAQAHCRAPDRDLDSVMLYLEGAVSDFENFTFRALWNTTYKWTFPDFGSLIELHLPRTPVVSVASVKYYDTDGALQTFASSNYTVSVNDQMQGVIRLNDSASWPDVDDDKLEGVEIAFVAGYGDDMDDVPGLVLNSLLVYAGHLYDNRTAEAMEDLQVVRDRCFKRFKARFLG